MDAGAFRAGVAAMVVSVLLVPVGAGSSLPSCEQATDEDAVFVEGRYVRQTHIYVEVWKESNDLDGLQIHSCEDADGGEHWSDTFVERVDPLDPPVSTSAGTGLLPSSCTSVAGIWVCT